MSNKVHKLVHVVGAYYTVHARELPWRIPEQDGSFDAYKILVSEMMLQQTQVPRVIPKYEEFLKTYPTLEQLAKASLADVLRLWSGLGYNRRARYLHQTAQMLHQTNNSEIPADLDELQKLPGIGYDTAAAIAVYAHNKPYVFVETNIRTVYIHHFFKDTVGVKDEQIIPLLEASLEGQNPRDFYWALMDYGTYLKRKVGNKATQSTVYKKQSQFQGSLRQLRGQVLRELHKSKLTKKQLMHRLADDRAGLVINDLVDEGLIYLDRKCYALGSL